MEQFTNGELRPISINGRTSSNHGVNIYGPLTDNRASITAVNINNTEGDYTFSLYRYVKKFDRKILLYTLVMDNGDILIDSTPYHLDAGDYLYLVPSIGSVNYVVEGLEYERNTIAPPFSGGGLITVYDKYGQKKAKCCGGGGEYEYDEIEDEVAAEQTFYQNNKLKNAKDLMFVIVNNQVYTSIKGDFTFTGTDITDGIIRFLTITLFETDCITIPFNRKL